MAHHISTIAALIHEMFVSNEVVLETITENRSYYTLTNGRTIRPSVVRHAINNLIIIHNMDGLFPGYSQSYKLRYGIKVTYNGNNQSKP
jgi:hypothetical protein